MERTTNEHSPVLAGYDLRAPAPPRSESITSQLQREILGEAFSATASPSPSPSTVKSHGGGKHQQGDAEINADAYRERDDAIAIGGATPEPRQHDDATKTTAAASSSSSPSSERRQTLSPGKMLLLFGDSPVNGKGSRRTSTAPSSRRNTASPEAIRSMLREFAGKEPKPKTTTTNSSTTTTTTSPMRRSTRSRSSTPSPVVNATRKRPRATEEAKLVSSPSAADQQAASAKETATSPSMQNPRGQGTSEAVAPSGEKTNDEEDEQDRTVEIDSLTSTFLASSLLTRGKKDGHHQTTEEKEADADDPRRHTIEPMDAAAVFAEIHAEMRREKPREDDDDAPVDPTASSNRHTRRSASLSPSAPSSPPSAAARDRDRKRRATLDPDDLVVMQNEGASNSSKKAKNGNESTRRDTIGDVELSELKQALNDEMPSSLADRNRRRRSSRGDSSVVATLLLEGARTLTPMKSSRGKRPRGEMASSTPHTIDPFLSPPPSSSRNRTPLKSCLSARKAKPGDTVVDRITTPNKTVNFGPPQGAEYNLGSPSTSMTPMCAKEARVRYPLDDHVSPPLEEEEDDEETSLNTSLLDEADAADDSAEEARAVSGGGSGNDEKKNGKKAQLTETSKDDEPMDKLAAAVLATQNRKLSVEPGVSARRRRRFSLRGVSPLDNQANARRQRRLSAAPSVSQQPHSPLVSARNRAALAQKKNGIVGSAGPKATSNSFLSAEDALFSQNRSAYADSSASSDDGEDMEITGDYSEHAVTAKSLHTGLTPTKSPQSSTWNSPRRLRKTSPTADVTEEHTVELGTLQDLVSESASYEERARNGKNKATSPSADEDGDLMGSLADLAREGEEHDSVEAPRAQGGDDDRRSSSAHSLMSMDSDESDAEYDEKRKSLVVNLSSKFDRIGSASPKPRFSPSKIRTSTRVPDVAKPKAPAPVLIKIEELLARAQLPDVEVASLTEETMNAICGSALSVGSAVRRSCGVHALGDALRSHVEEMSSWDAGLVDMLSSLAEEKASPVFAEATDTTETDTEPKYMEAIRSLHILESANVRSGYFQWRTKLESKVVNELVACQRNLKHDVSQLKSRVATKHLQRESEMKAMKELIEREQQMAQLLDGIDEQQGVQREYVASVELLESRCASLSLQENVLREQLAGVIQSAPRALRTEQTAMQLRRTVLEMEELLAVRESVSLWRVQSVDPAQVEFQANHDDVHFSVDVLLRIDIAAATGSASLSVHSIVHDKKGSERWPRGAQATDEEEEDDAVYQIATQVLCRQEFFQSFSASSVAIGGRRRGRLQRKVHDLDAAVSRAFRCLAELRSISAKCSLRFQREAHLLWMDFVRFPRRSQEGRMVDGLKFGVGCRLVSAWPHTDTDLVVEVEYGMVTEEKIRQQLRAVQPQGYEFIRRLSDRMCEVFVQ